MGKWHKIAVAMILLILPALASAGESGSELLSAGELDAAVGALRGEISASPNDAESHSLLCRAYFALGEWDRGIVDCERAVALNPNNSRYHLWLGRAYGEKADKSNFLRAVGLARKARSEFETAVELNPSSVDARTDLAEFYLEAPAVVGGGRGKAEAQALSLARLDPARADWVHGRIAEKQNDRAAAEASYRAAVQSSHGAASAWLNLGLFYEHGRRFDEMQHALEHVLAAPVDRPEALVDAAEILIRRDRNLPEAVRLLGAYLESKSSVEQAPAFKAHYLLGTALERQGDKPGAAGEYRTALSLANSYSLAREALDRVNR
jgi:tetratricopeptide (TPR) repeat protein